jgi:hypothetical protein
LEKEEVFVMQKNKKRVCGECPECKLGPKTKCFWQIEKSVPEHFKPSMIKAFVSVEEVDGMGYLKASEMDKAFDTEFLSWLLSFCVGNKVNVFWKTKNIPFCLGSNEFIEALTQELKEKSS